MASAHQGLAVWDVGAGRLLGYYASTNHNGGIAVAFTANGKQIVAASWGGHNDTHCVPIGREGRRCP